MMEGGIEYLPDEKCSTTPKSRVSDVFQNELTLHIFLSVKEQKKKDYAIKIINSNCRKCWKNGSEKKILDAKCDVDYVTKQKRIIQD